MNLEDRQPQPLDTFASILLTLVVFFFAQILTIILISAVGPNLEGTLASLDLYDFLLIIFPIYLALSLLFLIIGLILIRHYAKPHISWAVILTGYFCFFSLAYFTYDKQPAVAKNSGATPFTQQVNPDNTKQNRVQLYGNPEEVLVFDPQTSALSRPGYSLVIPTKFHSPKLKNLLVQPNENFNFTFSTADAAPTAKIEATKEFTLKEVSVASVNKYQIADQVEKIMTAVKSKQAAKPTISQMTRNNIAITKLTYQLCTTADCKQSLGHEYGYLVKLKDKYLLFYTSLPEAEFEPILAGLKVQ